MIKNKSWLYISVLTLIVALTWVTVSAVAHFRKSEVAPDVEKISSPLDPAIDTTFFAQLQRRATAAAKPK